MKKYCGRQRGLVNRGWQVRRVFFCYLLLVVLVGCESIERKVSISTSEDSSSKKVIFPIVEDEGVQEPIFAEPKEVPSPSGPVIQPQELEQASAEDQTEAQSDTFLQERSSKLKKIVVPSQPQYQIYAS